jgi:hypothetical protein
MASLVIELQKNALNENYPVSSLLRQAYLVSTKLKIDNLINWVRLEMNGYAEDDDIPEYRKYRGILKAHNPYHGWIETSTNDNKFEDMLTLAHTSQSIAEIEKLAESENPYLGKKFSAEQQALIQNIFRTDFPFMLFIPTISMHQILSAVRHSILDWSLKLEAEGILGDDYTFTDNEKEKATMSTNIHIGTFQGILGDISQSSVKQDLNQSISRNDFNALADFLRNNKVSDEDISELNSRITQDGELKEKSFGPLVSDWIGRMITKAADGSWNVAIGAAGNILASAISSYYGIG